MPGRSGRIEQNALFPLHYILNHYNSVTALGQRVACINADKIVLRKSHGSRLRDAEAHGGSKSNAVHRRRVIMRRAEPCVNSMGTYPSQRLDNGDCLFPSAHTGLAKEGYIIVFCLLQRHICQIFVLHTTSEKRNTRTLSPCATPSASRGMRI